MNQKKVHSLWKPFLFLLIIPIQIGLDVLLMYGGFLIDDALMSPEAETLGHGAPVFIGLGTLLAMVLTVIAIILALVLTTVFLIRAIRSRKQNMNSNALKE